MSKKKNIIFICTGNACRSQIAHGLLQNLAKDRFNVFSAGSHPSRVHLMSIKVMEEIGIDISHHTPKPVSKYLDENFDIVATVCDNARETCPVFTGSSKHQIHQGFIDPADAAGSDGEITEVYRRIRDKIQIWVDAISWNYLNN